MGAPRKVASESRERTFDHDIAAPEQLREALTRMAEQLCESLRRHGRRGRTISIKVRLDDWTTVTRSHTVETATDDTAHVTAEALRLLEEYAPPRPVRLLGVRVAGFVGHPGRETGNGAPGELARAAGEGQLALPLAHAQ